MKRTEGIEERLKAKGLGVSVRGKDNVVELVLLDKADALAAREILYKALSGLETLFTVFIKGMPFCFMPDAADHVLYRRKSGVRYTAVPQCKACALKALCPGIETGSVFEKKLRRALGPVLAAPNELVFELTKRCDLACRICFAGKTGGERPLRELVGLLKEARGLDIKNVRFTGGEPFLSPSLLPLLRAAKKAGFYTLVNTNACCADTSLLKKAAPLIDNVLVSMQGYDASGEEAATGVKGLFPRKLANMRRLRAAVPVFRLGTVASEGLIKNFKAYRALAAKLNADIWEIYRPMLDKKAEAAAPEFRLSPSDIVRLSGMIAALPAGGPRTLLANPVPFCLVPEAERRNMLGAAFDDGHTRLVHDPRGYFKPSYYIDERLGGTIGKAWNSAYMKELRSFSWLPRRCRTCDYLLKCLAGSRFRARAASGEYFSKDPWLP